MSTNDIDAIRKLADATEPDWVAETNDKGHAWINLPAYQHAWGMHGFVDEAKFAAAARTYVPALCDEVEQLRAELDAMRGVVDAAKVWRAQFSKPADTKLPRQGALIAAVDALPKPVVTR